MSEEENYFCEFDTENDLHETEEENQQEQIDLNPVTPPVEEEDVIYRLRRMLTDKDDEDYQFHEKNFKKYSNDLIEMALDKTTNTDRLSEGDYLSICTNLKNLFDSHKKMISFLIQVNNELKDDLNWYKKLLCESEELNMTISSEISDIKRQLDLDTPTSYYDELD
jgi:hypothetical protein